MQATILNSNQEELLSDVKDEALKERKEICHTGGTLVIDDQIDARDRRAARRTNRLISAARISTCSLT